MSNWASVSILRSLKYDALATNIDQRPGILLNSTGYINGVKNVTMSALQFSH